MSEDCKEILHALIALLVLLVILTHIFSENESL